MLRGGGSDHAMAGIEDLLGPAVVHLGRSQIGDAGMVVLVVVPGEEPLAEDALLGRLGIKRVRLAAELIALGTTWGTVAAKAESTTLIAVAGGPIPAGSLVSSTNPGGEFLWDGLLSVHLQDPDGAERSFSLALEDSLKSGDADVTEAALIQESVRQDFQPSVSRSGPPRGRTRPPPLG